MADASINWFRRSYIFEESSVKRRQEKFEIVRGDPFNNIYLSSLELNVFMTIISNQYA